MQKAIPDFFRRRLTLSNVFTLALAALVVSVLLFPEVKAGMISGLMKVGMFRPDFAGEKPVAPVRQTEELLLTDAAGNQVALSSLKGKIVLLNFWATWCPPCRAELPSLEKLARRWKDRKDLVILTIDVDGGLEKSRKFLDRRHIGLPVYAATGKVPDALLGGAVPTTDVLDKSGALMTHHEGAVNFDTPAMDQFLNDLK